MSFCMDISSLTRNPREATKAIAEIIINTISPLILRVRNKLQQDCKSSFEEDFIKLRDVYALCLSQIMKILQTTFEIFKTESLRKIFLQESRQCSLQRLSWCINRLSHIEEYLEKQNQESQNVDEINDNSILATPMYFVNWIDHTFDILSKLATIIYKPECNSLQSQWKDDVIDCVSTLHISLDELLLSAMTLGKYCLPNDQRVVTARCQVVLREAKSLLSELIEGELETAYRATPDLLKLPLKPSNVNILIDVLKDVLYALETNTNTALLTLLVHCFSGNKSPVDVLKEHLEKAERTCSCFLKSEHENVEDCPFINEFDLYNERLMQIGSFAVSCSSDHHRMTALRSGLATLEALDPHLVPALMLAPGGQHAALLASSWRQEVQLIRDSVFLIVDPGAFAEKSKQLMHQTLMEILKHKAYDNGRVCEVINIGCVVRDFFNVYVQQEPDALTQQDKLTPLLADLNKVQQECKIVSDLLSSGDNFVYYVKKVDCKTVSMDQLIKRLKLLYTLVSRINSLHHPKENEDQLFGNAFDEESLRNITHTIVKTGTTFGLSPKKPHITSRSIFVRSDVRSSTRNYPLSKLTKHLQAKKSEDISFSVKLDQLFNLSQSKSQLDVMVSNKRVDSMRETSILYNFSPRKRSSLRKAVLNKHCKILEQDLRKNFDVTDGSNTAEEDDVADEATSLQITGILNEINDITNTMSRSNNRTFSRTPALSKTDSKRRNIARSNEIDSNSTVSNLIWTIPINSAVGQPLDDSVGTNVSQPSNVTTLERISDIDFVESKLNSLKYLDIETSL